MPVGLIVVGNRTAVPALAGSRTIRPRSSFPGAVPLTRHRTIVSRVPLELLATISRNAQPGPLRPEVWERVLADAEVPGRETIIEALRSGVPLSLSDTVYRGVSLPNHPSIYLDIPRFHAALEEETLHGRYVKLPPSTDRSFLNVSAMGIAPRFKSFEARRAFEHFSNPLRPLLKHAALDDFEGRTFASGPGLAALGSLAAGVKWRIIHDLTHPTGENVNASHTSPYFQLPTALAFAQRLSQGAYIWKGDIDKAFRNVPVRQRDWPLLAFHADGVLYVDTRLPFGHVLSPYYFVNIVGRPVLYVAVRRGASLLGALASYIDDFFGGCDTYEDALDQMQLWLQVCADLGVPVSKAKTFLPAQVVEILGFIINTLDMTISVDSERIQAILDEIAFVEGRRAVRRQDLERLAGKMTFVCSVVPGGRTFMRNILTSVHQTRQPRHWVHLSAAFRADLLWWKRFAQAWNGVEVIPPAISIPWRWLTSDASGESGLGVFLCGAALHIPLSLSIFGEPARTAEHDPLIIAETELIAAVLLVALAAPLFGGEHLLLGIDNTNAISWIDSGTCRRPRAMRALRLLWRIQALYRVHISTRYITSAHNTLADSASRCDARRFFTESRSWLSANLSALRQYGLDVSSSSLVTSSFGTSGGAVGVLVERLVCGYSASISNAEDEMDGVLHQISTFAPRFLSQQHRRLHNVSGNRSKEGGAIRLQFDQGLHGLLGEGSVLSLTSFAEPSAASGSPVVSEGRRASAWEASREGGTLHGGASESTKSPSNGITGQYRASDNHVDRTSRLLGVSSSWHADSKAPRERVSRPDARRFGSTRNFAPYHGPSLQDESVQGASARHRAPGTGRPALVPLTRIDPMDLALATPVLPDDIVYAIHDKSYAALAFEVPRHPEQSSRSVAASHRALLSTRVREAGIHTRGPDLASHAAWGLEDAGGRSVLRRGCPDPESSRGPVGASSVVN